MSSVVWGSSDFLGGTMSRRRHPVAVLGGSQPFGLLAVSLAAVAMGKWGFTAGSAQNGALAGALGLAGLVCFYSALSAGRMGVVSPISSTGVLIPLGIGLLQGDRPSALQYLGVLTAIVGVILASGPELNGGAPVRPVALAGAAALFFGCAVYFMAVGGGDNPVMTVVMMRVTQVAILMAIAIAVRSTGGMRLGDAPLLAAIGVTDAGANVLYTTAAATGMLSLVSVLGSLFPVVTVLLAWRIHGERLMPIQYAGIVLTLGGVVAITAG